MDCFWNFRFFVKLHYFRVLSAEILIYRRLIVFQGIRVHCGSTWWSLDVRRRILRVGTLWFSHCTGRATNCYFSCCFDVLPWVLGLPFCCWAHSEAFAFTGWYLDLQIVLAAMCSCASCELIGVPQIQVILFWLQLLILDVLGGLLDKRLSFGLTSCFMCLSVVEQRLELILHRVWEQIARKTLHERMVDTLLLIRSEWFSNFWKLLDLLKLLLIQKPLLLFIFSRYLFLSPIYFHLQVALPLELVKWQVLAHFAQLFELDASQREELLVHNLHWLQWCCNGKSILIIIVIPWLKLVNVFYLRNSWWHGMPWSKLAAKSSWTHLCEAACEGARPVPLVLIAWHILIFIHRHLRLRLLQFFLGLTRFFFWAADVNVLSIFHDIACILFDVHKVVALLRGSQELVHLLTVRWQELLRQWLTSQAQGVIGVVVNVSHVFFYDDFVLDLWRPPFILCELIFWRRNRLRASVSWWLKHLEPLGVLSISWVYLLYQFVHLQQILDDNWLIHNFDVLLLFFHLLLWFIHIGARHLNLAALSIQIDVDDHPGRQIFGNPLPCHLSIGLARARYSFFLGLWLLPHKAPHNSRILKCQPLTRYSSNLHIHLILSTNRELLWFSS